jgi:hypothetical protein
MKRGLAALSQLTIRSHILIISHKEEPDAPVNAQLDESRAD